MNRERFLVKSFGDNIDGTKAGLIKLIQLLDAHDHVVIVVPEIGKIKGTILVDALGEDVSKALIKNREIAFQGNKKISLCAHSTLKNYRYADAYLALWGTEYMVADIEALTSWKSFVLVTWLPKDSAQWEAAHSVTVIYDDKKG